MHRVGAIPFDIKGEQVALLFVTSQTRGRWILPKGLVKEEESHIDACQRECYEEAGVQGTVLADYPMTVPISKQSNGELLTIPVTYYPVFVNRQSDKWSEKSKRERHWALLGDASKVVHREDLLAVIKQFESLAPWIKKAAADSKQ